MELKAGNPIIIVGHYGSGKTEFAVNYALHLSEHGKAPVLADMDIVNPYFRARELREHLKLNGIRVISSNCENDPNLDMPSLAASLRSCFEAEEQTSIIDAGGDPSGANVLAGYSKLLSNRDYSMWIVVNANRPQTAMAEDAAAYITSIENASRLKVNGIINNTHMLGETTIQDIRKGDELARSLSKLTGIRLVCTVIEERLKHEAEGMEFAGEPFFIKILMMPEWLKSGEGISDGIQGYI